MNLNAYFLNISWQMKFLVLLLLIQISVSGQEEKRLGLVIGNSDYSVGRLDNPVNDAVLMAKTLDSLHFDVILDTNLATRRDFIESIKKFGMRIPEYDVAFIYYAGHGIQLNNENYMLPTKENFESEFDVEEYGVKVQSILRFLNSDKSKISVFVLDACRNNPFESSWSKTRSMDKGSGLAGIEAPSGSLIAFSTAPGSTTPDGTGNNSLYCSILSKQLLVPESSIEQVFRNVRSEIHSLTNGEQRPVENTQLLGEEYFLIPRNFEKELRLFNDYLLNNKLTKCLELTASVLSSDSSITEAWIKRGHAYALLGENKEARESYSKALELDSSAIEAYTTLIKYKAGVNEFVGLLNLSDTDSILKKYYASQLLPFANNNPIVFRELTHDLFLYDNFFPEDSKSYRKLLNDGMNITQSNMNYWIRRMCISEGNLNYSTEHRLVALERLMHFYYYQWLINYSNVSTNRYHEVYGDSIRQLHDANRDLPQYSLQLAYHYENYLLFTGQYEQVVELYLDGLNRAKSPKDSCYSAMKFINGIYLSTQNFPYNQIENFINIFNSKFEKEKLGTYQYDFMFKHYYNSLVNYYSVINPDYYKSREYITNYLIEVIDKSTGSKTTDPFIDISKKEVIKSVSNTFDLTTVASTYYCFYISQFLDANVIQYDFDHIQNIANMLQLNGLNFYTETTIINNQEVELIYDSPEMFSEKYYSDFSNLSYVTIVHQNPNLKKYIVNLDETEKLKFRALLEDAIIFPFVNEELDRQLRHD